jgi:formate--tetrahydrofolate ligase
MSPSSLEISQSAILRPIEDVARNAGLLPEELEPYGRYKGKVDLSVLERLGDRPDGRLVVVTGITPTSAGEGKTTTSIALAQGMAGVGARAMLCLREPSMGPVFGAKGGGTGGGRAQVVPMEDINLHFTGDFHAVAAAHNLLAAAVDASLHHGNPTGMDARRVTWPRALDVNDRALRHVEVGLGKTGGVPRESGFVITAASEVMAILALADGPADLRDRLGRIVVAETADGGPVTAEDLRAAGAMAAVLRDTLRPNLVQTLEGQPVLIHAGPFGNIASGNNSVLADRVAMKLADVVFTEAGFGTDLGFEKFCHLVSRADGVRPSAAVIVATVRALKLHGGMAEAACMAGEEDVSAVERGAENLAAHVDNVRAFGIPAVVAVNRVAGDTDREVDLLVELARELEADEVAVSDGFERGGPGAQDLAKAVLAALERPSEFRPLNPPETPLREQIERVATRLYGAGGVEFSPDAEKALRRLDQRGLSHLPVCMAKSHMSLSHDPAVKGRPRGFVLPVRDLVPSVGAGFVIALCGDVLLMPGLGKEAAYRRIDVDEDGRITGLS